MSLKLMYITNNPQVARIAEENGVDRIWIDLEKNGKEERQKGLNSVKSKHSQEDISAIRKVIGKRAELMVRVNPIFEGSKAEIDDAISRGADILMLPMFKTMQEVKCFIDLVGGRAKTMLLVETKEAAQNIEEIVEIEGIDEIHIGLNDLHLSYGLSFMFELLSNGCVERLCSVIAKAGIPYGFGGVARLDSGMIAGRQIIMEHYRLGSSMAILSRSFCNTEDVDNIDEIEKIFSQNMKEFREYESYCQMAESAEFNKNKKEVKKGVKKVVKELELKNKKSKSFRFYKDIIKRTGDILCASIALVVASPILLIVALLVKIDSKGPAIFVQERLTLNGRVFKMYKFRTMCVNAENQGTGAYSFDDDPRITRVGAILRKLSLDELPQLVNIIKGDMSFIGPRPILTYHPCKYEEYTEEEKTVFTVRPGITGWAQVNGRNNVDWIQRFELNKWYVKNVSLLLDIKIVFMTIFQVFSTKETVIQEKTAENFAQRIQKENAEVK